MSYSQPSGTNYPVHYVQVELPNLIPSSASNNYQCQPMKTYTPTHVPNETNDSKSKDNLIYLQSNPLPLSHSQNLKNDSLQTTTAHRLAGKSISLYINTNNLNNNNNDNIKRDTDCSPQYESGTKDFLSSEAKQAAANIKDTKAAIADRRFMFFHECPKSPSSPLRQSNSSSIYTSPFQRSSLLLDKEMDSMKISNKNEKSENSASSISSQNLNESPKSSDLFKKLNNNRYSYRTVDLIKQCPPLELYTTSPILSPVTMEVNSTTIFRPETKMAKSERPIEEIYTAQTPPPPNLSIVTTEPIVLQISESIPSSAINTMTDNHVKLSFSPYKHIHPVNSDMKTGGNTGSSWMDGCRDVNPTASPIARHECYDVDVDQCFDDKKHHGVSRLEIELKNNSQAIGQDNSIERDEKRNISNFATSTNSNDTFGETCPVVHHQPTTSEPVGVFKSEFDKNNEELNKSQKYKTCLDLNEVTFFSAPDNYFPYQDAEQPCTDKSQFDLKQEEMQSCPSEESLPSTPNSGSLSSSMKSASINKLKAFFTEGTNIFGSEMKQVDSPDPGISLSDSMDSKKLPELNVKPDKSSFKARRSVTKQQQNNIVINKGSPIFKHKKSPTEKESQGHKESWKGRVARTIKRYGSGSILLTSDTIATVAEDAKVTGVFGVPLEACEPSTNDPLVPMIVDVCVRIVEERGLDNQGIYRVPGNTGAMKELQDEINKCNWWGPSCISTGTVSSNDEKGLCLCSEKWQDVNLVSSLLKLFFRKLPDSLITDELYESVIAAMRTEKSEKRMLKLKKLLHDLPDRNFNTFRFLMKHLSLVASHEECNKMDAHNLAIMFGPTLIRPQDNNIGVMARNMAEQCRVVETIVTHCDWFFSSWDEDVYVPVDEESDDLTPVINEQMVAKAQSMGSSNKKNSPSSNRPNHHRHPNHRVLSLSQPSSPQITSSSKSSSSSTSRHIEAVVSSVVRAANRKLKLGGNSPSLSNNNQGIKTKGSSSTLSTTAKKSTNKISSTSSPAMVTTTMKSSIQIPINTSGTLPLNPNRKTAPPLKSNEFMDSACITTLPRSFKKTDNNNMNGSPYVKYSANIPQIYKKDGISVSHNSTRSIMPTQNYNNDTGKVTLRTNTNHPAQSTINNNVVIYSVNNDNNDNNRYDVSSNNNAETCGNNNNNNYILLKTFSDDNSTDNHNKMFKMKSTDSVNTTTTTGKNTTAITTAAKDYSNNNYGDKRGKEVELVIELVHHSKYNVNTGNSQYYHLADNRSPAQLPWKLSNDNLAGD